MDLPGSCCPCSRLNRNHGFCINSYDDGEAVGSCMGRKRSARDLARPSTEGTGIPVPDWEYQCQIGRQFAGRLDRGVPRGTGRSGGKVQRAKKWGLQEPAAFAAKPCSPSPRSVLQSHNGPLVTAEQRYEGLETYVPILCID